MDSDKQDDGLTPELSPKLTIFSQLLRFLFTLLGIILVLFGCSGRLDWFTAWVYLAVYTIGYTTNAVILMPRDPSLTDERGRSQERIKGWERVITSLLAVLTFSLLALAGLQVRFSWTSFMPVWARISGFTFLVLGKALTSWALASNRYFTTNVYFQTNRDQVSEGSGPYHFIRHPGYAGLAVSALATPLLLGTGWALIPAAMTVVLFVVYTLLEDRTLLLELDGYDQYSRRVRYRLLPGIW